MRTILKSFTRYAVLHFLLHLEWSHMYVRSKFQGMLAFSHHYTLLYVVCTHIKLCII